MSGWGARAKAAVYGRVLGVLERFLQSRSDGRRWLYEQIPYLPLIAHQTLGGVELLPDPYREPEDDQTGRRLAMERDGVIFISGRFRSGSTLLWNLFRDLPGTTAYYEPFNERKWFLRHERGDRTDQTHVGVVDYWREYDELEELDRYFDIGWNDQNLLMSETAWEPQMARYLDALILNTQGCAVLQFNRADFRLPWLLRHYPRAKIVHLYRDPREQWISTLQSKDNCRHDDTFASMRKNDFFYLRRWCRDLSHLFPFLDERTVSHPYELHYYLWRLSFSYGRRYSHHSLAFESLITHPRQTLTDLFAAVDVNCALVDEVIPKIGPVCLERWKDYAPNSWFLNLESRCDEVLRLHLAPASTAARDD